MKLKTIISLMLRHRNIEKFNIYNRHCEPLKEAWQSRRFCYTIVLTIFLVFYTNCVFAGESNNSQNKKSYKPIEVTIGSGKIAKNYLLMNNGLDINRWYYASLNPKLYEYGSPVEPDLMMVKFQKVNKNKKEKLDEGAIFRCSFDIGADNAVIKKLKKYLPDEIDSNKVKLSVLPLEGIELSFLNPNNQKELSIVATNSSELVPMEGSRVFFDTVLDKNTTAIVDALLKTKIGIEYNIKYHYSVFSKPIKNSFIAKIAKNKAVISGYPPDLDPSLIKYLKSKEDNPRLLQNLKSESHKNTKQQQNNNSSSKENEDLKNIGHKDKLKASRISDVSLNNYQKAINLTYRIKEDKIHAASGFITLNDYDENIIKKKVIQDTSYLNWNYSYLVMPNINEKLTCDINQIGMLVELMNKNKVYEKRNYVWNKEKGWRNVEKNYPATIDKFNLDDIYSESSTTPLKNAKFRINIKIEFEDNPPIKAEMEIPVIEGETPIATPFALCGVLTFDFTNLFWDALESDKSRLVSMKINVKDGNRRIERTVQPVKVKGTKAVEIPTFIYMMTTLDSFQKGNMKANIYFKTADGKRIPWEFNDMVLNKYFESPYIMFFDEDWKK